MLPSEEELLEALAALIVRRSDGAKRKTVEVLARYLTVAYEIGGQQAGKEVGTIVPIGLDGLDPVLNRLAPVLDETFDNLSGELTGIIEQGIHKNSTYAEVRTLLGEKLDGGWGKSVTFTRAGETRRYVHVAPDGSLEWRTKTITRNVTLPTETYADTLSRTNLKAAWAEGHRERYRQSGRKGWVFMAVADERTRPHHLALHGRVFIFGTEEEAMALAIMEEPNCRCRPRAWFDDPALDRDPLKYLEERQKWAKAAQEDFPTGSPWQKFLDGVIAAPA